jgi:hypothetical protein
MHLFGNCLAFAWQVLGSCFVPFPASFRTSAADLFRPLDFLLHPVVVVAVLHAREEPPEDVAHCLHLVGGPAVADARTFLLIERHRAFGVPTMHERQQENPML